MNMVGVLIIAFFIGLLIGLYFLYLSIRLLKLNEKQFQSAIDAPGKALFGESYKNPPMDKSARLAFIGFIILVSSGFTIGCLIAIVEIFKIFVL